MANPIGPDAPPPPVVAPGGGGAGFVLPKTPVAPVATAAPVSPYAWSIPLFEHYIGRPPTAAELASVGRLGFNYDSLVTHLRNQPSRVKGMTNGALEDLHKSANPAFAKWLGTEPSDQDIQQLVNQGIRTPDAIEKYLTNRADVIAAHPGAPIGLSDQEYGRHKSAIDSQYLANTGTAATDQQARDAYAQAASPFRKQPSEQIGLSAGVTGGAKGQLMSEAQIAPNARNGY